MKKKKQCKRLRIAAIILGVLLLIGAIIAWRVWSYANSRYSGDNVRLYVNASDGIDSFRDSVSASLGSEFGNRVFSLYNKIAGDAPLKSGSYIIHHGDKAWETARRIRNGQQDPVRVTFNNLRTMPQLAQRLDEQLLLSADSFLSAADSILSGKGIARENYAAYFMPDTYEFYWTDSPAKVINRLLDYHSQFWTDERMSKAKKIGLNPEQVATLASIVEEETNMSDERPKVARLYLNRLNRGMLLQADPTVKFAIGDFTIRRVLNSHLQSSSPYNTYRYPGLPPGPIRIPAAATLDAVLNAPAHSYIYMCAKEDFSGYHNFARDLSTHNANARRYQDALNRRGIRR